MKPLKFARSRVRHLHLAAKTRLARWRQESTTGRSGELLANRRPRSKTLRTTRGYTLLEMLVAVGVVSLVSAASYPAATDIYESYSFRSAVDQVRFEVKRARMQASAQSRFVRIRIDGDGALVREHSEDGVAYEQDVPPAPLPGPINAVVYGQAPEFNPAGLGKSWSVIAVRSREHTKHLIINPLGKVYAE